MMLAEWRQLKCICGDDTFYSVVHLRWNSVGTGTTAEPAGWRCAACQQPVDMAALIRLAQLVEKQRELAALKRELEPALPETEHAPT